MTKIIAVVVTYNRPDLLPKTVASILSQTRALDKIIVVDNASDTPASEILQPHPLLHVERMTVNSGGSGGFAHGMRLALQEGADWVWVMDDDVSPRAECLSHLLSFKGQSECIHPKKILPNGTEDSWEQLFNFKWSTPFKIIGNPSFRNGKNITFTNVACFEGMLASARLISKVGFKYEDYFITHDDVLFGGISSLYTNVGYAREAVIDKLLPSSPAKGWKLYYYMRNSFWVVSDYCERAGIKLSALEKLALLSVKFLVMCGVMFRDRHSISPSIKGYLAGAMTVMGWARQR